MSMFVYRSQSSTGARELADALGGRRLRRFEGGRFFGSRTRPNPITVRPNDVLVMWGGYEQGIPAGVKVLNNAPIHSKFEDAEILRRAGVATIEVSRTRPNQAAAAPAQPVADPAVAIHRQVLEQLEDLVEAPFNRNDIYIRGVNDATTAIQRLQAALRQPVPAARPVVAQPNGEWMGRTNNHVGGTDLLNPPANPDFFVKKLQIVEEYRIHSFCGKSIRAGKKVQRPGFANPSAWVRSDSGGWFISYDGFKSKEAMRTLAHNAVKVLGLDFGAVDIAKLQNGSLLVLEVNRAPGVENGTTAAYAGAIQKWSEGTWEAAVPRAQRRAA